MDTTISDRLEPVEEIIGDVEGDVTALKECAAEGKFLNADGECMGILYDEETLGDCDENSFGETKN